MRTPPHGEYAQSRARRTVHKRQKTKDTVRAAVADAALWQASATKMGKKNYRRYARCVVPSDTVRRSALQDEWSVGAGESRHATAARKASTAGNRQPGPCTSCRRAAKPSQGEQLTKGCVI